MPHGLSQPELKKNQAGESTPTAEQKTPGPENKEKNEAQLEGETIAFETQMGIGAIIRGSAKADTGPDKVFAFLSRTGLLEHLNDKESLRAWIKAMSYEDFRKFLVRLNGIVREVPIHQRHTDGSEVEVSSVMMGTAYLPPVPEDKEALIAQVFDCFKKIENMRDAGLLLYVAMQALHLFVDGNGRTGRLIFTLLSEAESGAGINAEKVRQLLTHTGDTGPGRELFQELVISPERIYTIIDSLISEAVVGHDFRLKYGSVYSCLQIGNAWPASNRVPEDMKNKLSKILAESYGGAGPFMLRDQVIVRHLENHNLLGKYKGEDCEMPLRLTNFRSHLARELYSSDATKLMYLFDGEEYLDQISEEDGQELLSIHRNAKRLFIEKLIDVVAQPEKYPVGKQCIKDHFYASAEGNS